MTAKWYRAVCLGAALVVSLWAASATAQPAPASKPAATADPAEAVPELQNQIRVLTAQVKTLQAAVAKCQQELARMNHQDDDAPVPSHTPKTNVAPHTMAVNTSSKDDDDAPATSLKTTAYATTRESAYDSDAGVQAGKTALEQYIKDLKPLEDKTVTDAQRSKIASDAATKLGKALARRICITAIVQNVSVAADNKAAIMTLANSVRETLRQSKLTGVVGGEMGNPIFHVTLTEDQAALLRKGDEMLVNAACTVNKDVTSGGTVNPLEVVVIGIQGGWHLILSDYTCKTGQITARVIKSAVPKSTAKPAKAVKKPVITNSSD